MEGQPHENMAAKLSSQKLLALVADLGARKHGADNGPIDHPPEGTTVTVTCDAILYEQECKKSNLSWQHLTNGRLRSSKMGCSGIVENVDLSDSTVELSGGLSHGPIRCLVGFEHFSQGAKNDIAKLIALELGMAPQKFRADRAPAVSPLDKPTYRLDRQPTD